MSLKKYAGSSAELLVKGTPMSSLIDAARYGLSDEHEAFCRDVTKNHDVAAAYIKTINSAMSNESAYKAGVSLLCREDVGTRVRKLEEGRRLRRDTNKDAIMGDIARVLKVTIADYFKDAAPILSYDDDGVIESSTAGGFEIKPMTDWTEDMKLACKDISIGRSGWNIKLYDKEVLIDRLARMGGHYAEEKVKVQSVGGMSNKSDEELMNIIDTNYEEVLPSDGGKDDSKGGRV